MKYSSKYVTPSVDEFELFLLLYADYVVDRGEIEAWSKDKLARVYDYYADRFFMASDNVIRSPRPRPAFLGDYWPT